MAAFCRFWLPFQLPLILPFLVAVLHGQIPGDSLNYEFPNQGI
jgi:hypothetical protein